MKPADLIQLEIKRESDFQKKAAKYLRDRFPYPETVWWHTANERNTSKQRGHSLKLQGVLPGVSDIIVLNWQAGFELKMPTGSLSKSQREFRDALQDIGWKFYTCKNWQQWLDAVADASGLNQAAIEQRRIDTLARRYCG